MARGYSQRFGVDYFDIFVPVVRLDSVRCLLAVAARRDLELVHLDVKTAFSHGRLSKDICMEAPQGFELEKGLSRERQAVRNEQV